jgi:hypothetical protein
MNFIAEEQNGLVVYSMWMKLLLKPGAKTYRVIALGHKCEPRFHETGALQINLESDPVRNGYIEVSERCVDLMWRKLTPFTERAELRVAAGDKLLKLP